MLGSLKTTLSPSLNPVYFVDLFNHFGILNEGIFNELRERTGFKSRGEKRRLEKAAGRRRYLRNQKKLKDSRGY